MPGVTTIGWVANSTDINHNSFILCLHLYSHHCSKHSQLFQANAIAENMTAFLKQPTFNYALLFNKNILKDTVKKNSISFPIS